MVAECAPMPAYIWHRTKMLGRRCWLTVGRAGGEPVGRTRVRVYSNFGFVMVLGRYVEFGWR